MDTTKKILVTGGCGFIGRWISKSLIESGHEVYIVDDLSGSTKYNMNDFYDDLAGFYQIDLSETKKTYEMINEIKPEVIYHAASSAREGASFFDPIKITKTNYMAYINTLESAIKTGKLDKVILFSSMAVYGSQRVPFSEDLERRPEDIYAINKSAMEQTTEMLSAVHSFRYTILRPHNVFGKFQSLRDKYRNVIGIMMNKIMRDEPIYIYGDGLQMRSFSYIEDSLDCYIEAMKDKCDGEIINIGGKIPLSINKLTELVCRTMGTDYDTYPIEHLPDRYSEVKVAYTTWKKSAELLGYKEDIGYEEGIRKMAKWARSMGPQEWTTEKLELWNNKAPFWWNE